MAKKFSIAIDGPGGAGKSTAAKAVAEALGALYLDTGAMYRAMGLYMLKNEVNLRDGRAVAALAGGACIDIRYEGGNQRMILCGEDVTDRIRRPEVSSAASMVSRVPAVRRRMVGMQQAIAAECAVVMDGRDIGTRVLPDATLKVYLTADVEERARRRYEELRAKSITFDQVLSELVERDNADLNRSVAPLRKADDAVEIDTTHISLDQVVERIVELARAKIAEVGDA
ncbi:MAG: (d)CMP kinase [Clostridiales bacterium]|nr:(d)CMP kinase [Clostridiales bacterium]